MYCVASAVILSTYAEPGPCLRIHGVKWFAKRACRLFTAEPDHLLLQLLDARVQSRSHGSRPKCLIRLLLLANVRLVPNKREQHRSRVKLLLQSARGRHHDDSAREQSHEGGQAREDGAQERSRRRRRFCGRRASGRGGRREVGGDLAHERQQHRGVDLGGCQRNATRSAQKPQSDSQRGVNKVSPSPATAISIASTASATPGNFSQGRTSSTFRTISSASWRSLESCQVCATSQPSKPLRESNSRAAVGMLVARTRNCRGGLRQSERP